MIRWITNGQKPRLRGRWWYKKPQFMQQQMQAAQAAARAAAGSAGQVPMNLRGPQGQQGQQGALKGQIGGINGPIGPGMPGQSPAMPTLNRPAPPGVIARPPSQNAMNQGPQRAGGQTPIQNQNAQHPNAQQRPPPGQQQLNGVQAPGSQPNGMQGPNGQQLSAQQQQQMQMAMQITPQMRQHLASLPTEQRMAALRQFQNKMKMMQMQRQQGQLQQNGSAPNQMQQQQTSQGQNLMNRPGGQVNTSAPAMGQKPPMQGQRNQLQPGQVPQQGQPKIPMQSLTNDQYQMMDAQSFPPSILSTSVTMQHLPQGVKTWGGLKAWVMTNSQQMPTDILDKLRGLQALHFHTMMAKRQQMNAMSQAPAGSVAPSVSGPAPMAPMAPPRQAQGIPNTASVLPPGMPRIPEPSAPELQAFREKYPQLRDPAVVPDDRLRALVMNRRVAQMQQNQAARLQAEAGQKPQPQQTPNLVQAPKPTQQNAAPQQRAQAANQAPAPPKGVKRPNPDDVVEVPNPNLSQEQRRQQQKQGQQQQSTPQQQQHNLSAAKAPTHAPGSQPGQRGPQSVPPLDPAKMARFNQLRDEVSRTLQHRPPVSMDMQTKNQMIALLREALPMIQRAEQGIYLHFAVVDGDEGRLKQLLQTRLLLARQYRDQTFSNPAENFTINIQELRMAIQKLRQTFTAAQKKKTEVSAQFSQAMAKQSSQQPPVQQRTQQQQPPQPEVSAARPMAKPKSNRDTAPPAPTSDKPPSFPFGPTSPPPHGIPKYPSATPSLTPEQLTIPSKKRKLNQPTTASQTQGATATTAPAKTAPQQIPRSDPTFRCPVPNCESSKTEFPTQEALAKHHAEKHVEKEPEDPLAFTLEALASALGLDSHGKPVAKETETKMEKSMSSQTMKTTASNQGINALKVEGGTPMMRGLTGQGSNLGIPRTPQGPGSAKSPGSNQKVGTPNVKLADTSAPKGLPTPPPDLWASASISPSELSACFPAIHDCQGVTMLANSTLTPASTLSTVKSANNSPKGSDIGSGDVLDITIDAIDTSAWMNDFVTDAMDTSVDPFANDDILSMSWDALFPPEKKEKTTASKGARKQGKNEPNFDVSLFSVKV